MSLEDMYPAEGSADVSPLVERTAKLAYVGGRVAAMRTLKLAAMDLAFDSPQEAQAHLKRRGTIQSVTGFAGDVAGGLAGGTVGTAVGGPVGGFAGGMAGGMAASKLLSAPATTLYDMQHDTRYRGRRAHDKTLRTLNAAAATPATPTVR